MASNLKAAEFLADTLVHKVSQLLTERNTLRTQLAQKTSGSLDGEKAFVQLFRDAVLDRAYYAAKSAKLEHLLLVR